MKHPNGFALQAALGIGLVLSAGCSTTGVAAEPRTSLSGRLPAVQPLPVLPAGAERVASPTPERLLIPDMSARLMSPTRSVERPVLAVDIDETLSVTDYQNLMWGIGKDDGMPLPGSQAAMNRLAATFDIVYVTARSRSMKNKTERWLSQHGFPEGRIVTSPTVGDFLFQGNFKEKIIRKLRQEYPNMVAGIGDKAKDGKAYRKGGMVSVIVNPWPSHTYHADDVVLRDWAAVADFFQANHAVLSNPRLLRERLDAGRPAMDASGEAREFRNQS